MKRLKNRRGFTMVELLIVVAIMGVLSAVAITSVLGRQRSLARLERDTIAKEIFVAAQNHLTLAKSQGYLGLLEDEGEDDDSGTKVSVFGIKESPDLTSAAEPTSSIDSDTSSDIYYIVKGEGNPGQEMLNLMLPEGSIDGTVRSGGSYIIRYQKDLARVLDVFYTVPYGPQYDCVLQVSDYNAELLSNRSDLKFRQDFGKEFSQTSYQTAVLGWYGGEEARLATFNQTEMLSEPEIKVVNAEMLYVLVKDPNTGSANDSHQIQLVVKGVTSGYQTVFTLKNPTDTRVNNLSDSLKTFDGVTYDHIVVLDDITTPGHHFADMKDPTSTSTGGDGSNPSISTVPPSFIPGEDIVVQAMVYDDTRLTNIAESNKETANSLYAGIMTVERGLSGDKSTTAYINNFRHLENLYQTISSVQIDEMNPEGSLRTAEQTADLDWAQFRTTIPTMKKSGGSSIYIYTATETTAQTGNNYYHPVNPNYELLYDGKMHSISNVETVWNGDAGLFGKQSTSTGSEGGTPTIHPLHIKDVELIDFSITATASGNGSAGALVGTLNRGSVTNVLAHNTPRESIADEPRITAQGSGSAGGLIGMMTGGTVPEEKMIDRCAAALLVESKGGNAGGLIGTANGLAITDSYSGGHTTHDSGKDRVYYDPKNPNVKAAASGAAGGFIGKIDGTGTTINYSYSTCSAEGGYAGGFVGNASAGTVNNCYSTGLVEGSSMSTEGAFAGCTTLTATGCQYFEIINERPITGEGGVDLGYECLDPLPNATSTGITALDATVDKYQEFCGVPDTWLVAIPYDNLLSTLYQGRYNLRTVDQLKTEAKIGVVAGEGSPTSDDVSLGAGGATATDADIPTPADYVVDHYGDWPAPEVFTPNTPDT